MKVALDGCDCVGKSSVAEKLANKIGCNIIRLTYKGDRSTQAYEELMRPDNMVHDRTFLSEIVYPKYFNRASRLIQEDIPELFCRLRFHKIKVFILTASDETILERAKKRGDEFIDDLGKFVDINQDYLEIAKKHNYTVIDTSNKTIDEVVEEIEKELKYD